MVGKDKFEVSPPLFVDDMISFLSHDNWLIAIVVISVRGFELCQGFTLTLPCILVGENVADNKVSNLVDVIRYMTLPITYFI